MKSIFMPSLFAVALLATKPILAATAPSLCLESARSKASYGTGVQLGINLVQRAWQSVEDCSQLEVFAGMVRENVKSYVVHGSASWTICRYTGVVDGAYEQLDAVWMSCNADCCKEGELVGRLGADSYCLLSQLLGGLAVPDEIVPRPVSVCGAFSDCCVATYGNTSREECSEYTDGTFAEVWTESRAVQCVEP